MPKTEHLERPIKADEDQLVWLVNNFYTAALLGRQTWTKNWSLYPNMFMSEGLWPAGYERTEIDANFIRRIIYHKAGLLFFSKPRVVVNPFGKGANREGAEQLQRILDSVELDQGDPRKRINDFLFGSLFGISNRKVWYDPWDNPPLGRIRTGSISPIHIYPDPLATSIEDARFVIYARLVATEEVFKRYGVWVKPEEDVSLLSDEAKRILQDHEWNVYSAMQYTGQARVLVKECLWRDPTVVVEKVKIDGKTFDIRKPKYPYGRMLTVGGGRVLKDGAYENKRWPHIVKQYYLVPFRWCGIGEVQNLMSLQLDLLKGLGAVSDNRNQTANTAWMVDSNSGVEPDMITNEGGLIIVKTPGSNVERMSPPAMPSYVAEHNRDNQERMELLAGALDFRLAGKPITHTGGIAFEAQQMAGHTSMRLQLEEIESAIEQDGDLKVEIIRRHWRKDQTYFATDGDEMKEYSYDPNLSSEGVYKVRVGHGSTMPVSRQRRRDDALVLYQAGVIDKEEVLWIMDVDNREGIIERMNEREQELARKAQETGIGPDKFVQPSKGRLPAESIKR